MKFDIQDIEDIIGADNLSSHDETRRLYSRDIAALPSLAYQIIENQFELIAQPQTVLSLAKIVAYCYSHELPIVPRGSGTSGWGGALPTHGGVCISTLHLSEFVHIDEYKMLVTIEAGMTWKELLVFLEQIGMTLPVYPSSASAATIGGFVASGGLGIGSAKYGDIRSQVAGMEVILPNGMIARIGEFLLRQPDELEAEAAKGSEYLRSLLDSSSNKEKLELMDLFLGLFGTFGLISRVTLRIIPKLVLRPAVCIFNGVDDLASAIQDIQNTTNPYYMRFITDSYTTKRFSPRSSIDEYGKFMLNLAYLDTFYQVDEDLEKLKEIVGRHNGSLTGEKRAEYHWKERLYPLRIKTLGPSLVPAEVLINLSELPNLYRKIIEEIGIDAIAIEGTVGLENITSFLVWILDDEREKLHYTLGWHRSFDVAALASQVGGKPYAVALWNVPFADEFYGKNRIKALKQLKQEMDPDNIMNPMKVFGGRIRPKRESLAFGFMIGYFVALLGQVGVFLLPGLNFLSDVLWAPVGIVPLPFILSFIGGIAGFAFIKFLTLRTALRLGIPMLRLAKRLLRV